MSKRQREIDSEFGFYNVPQPADDKPTMPNPCLLLLSFFAAIGVISFLATILELVVGWLR